MTPASDLHVALRARTADDLDDLEALAGIVQEVDGYPPHPPSELRGFVAAPDALAAWVAVADDEIVGHVALHSTSSPEVVALASARTGTRPEDLAVVARLFVAPPWRHRSLGTGLLREATSCALALGRTPVLDVAIHFHAAIALYEKQGWSRAGEVSVAFRGRRLHEAVYVYGPRGGGCAVR